MRIWIGLSLLIGLTACDQTQAPSTAIPPPSFWRVEIVEDSGGQTGVVEVCANSELISSFTRVEPSIGGQPCEPYGKPATDTATEHVGRCQANGQRFGLYTSVKGDPASDFTVRFALQPLQADIGKVVQARRYRRIGDCPAGWTAGEQRKAGAASGSNLLRP